MLRLLLLRHAKSSWDHPGMADIDRPLNDRGRRSTPVIGRYMAENGLIPDRILCSSAQRTRETLAGLLPFFKAPVDVNITGRLYHTTEDTYLPVIRSMAGTAKTLLLIGHNPATQDTALETVATSNSADLAAMDIKFPTCALAEISFAAKTWQAVGENSGNLERFIRPRDLQDETIKR